MPIGQYFGVQVVVSWPFLALLVLAASFGFWPHALLLFGSLLAHELAHLMVAQGLEVAIRKVELQPYGGIAYLEQANALDPYAESATAAAGPANNFLLLAAGVLLQRWSLFRPELLDFFLEINLSMALFNLLPALPLDGGRIYRAYLRRRHGYEQATRRLVRLGRFAAACLVVLAAVGLLFNRVHLPLLIFAPFLFQGARREEDIGRYQFWLDIVQRPRDPQHQGPLPVQAHMVPASTPLADLARLFRPGRFHIFTLTDTSWQVVGQLHEAQVVTAILQWGPDLSAGEAWEKLRPPSG